MRRQQGEASWTSPDGPAVRLETFTCAHCNSIVMVRPKAPPSELGEFCRLCMALVCPKCVGACTPFEKKLEAQERRDRLYRQVVG